MPSYHSGQYAQPRRDKRIPLDAKYVAKYKNSQTRYNERRLLKFENFDLVDSGQVWDAKPQVSYNRETRTRTKAPYLIGLELEIETRDGYINTEKLGKALNEFLPKSHYVCNDGSLNYGVEIVTAPRSVNEIRQSYLQYHKLLGAIKNIGFISHDSGRCGLHVHVSRPALSEIKWRQLERFILGTQAELFKFLSRRSSFNFCQFQRQQTRLSRRSRYTAINFENDQTIEFRFFRGTLAPDSFMGSLEIIFALVDFFREFEGKRATFKQFREYFAKSRYSIGAKYFFRRLSEYEQLHPTPERIRRSREEREARRAARAREREIRIQAMRDGIESMIRHAQQSLPVPRIDHSVRESVTLVPVSIPMTLAPRDGWRMALTRFVETERPQISVLVPQNRVPSSVVARRRRGYGSDRRWFEFRYEA